MDKKGLEKIVGHKKMFIRFWAFFLHVGTFLIVCRERELNRPSQPQMKRKNHKCTKLSSSESNLSSEWKWYWRKLIPAGANNTVFHYNLLLILICKKLPLCSVQPVINEFPWPHKELLGSSALLESLTSRCSRLLVKGFMWRTKGKKVVLQFSKAAFSTNKTIYTIVVLQSMKSW